MNRKRTPEIDGLVVSGLTELALGALTGRPRAIAVARPQDVPKIGAGAAIGVLVGGALTELVDWRGIVFRSVVV